MKDIFFISKSYDRMERADDICLFYCLVGGCDIQVEDRKVQLNVKDVFSVNSGEHYCVRLIESSALVLVVTIASFQIQKRLGCEKFSVVLSSTEHPSRDYGQIRFLMESMVTHAAVHEEEFKLKSLYYMLWDSICDNFIIADTKEEKKEDRRIEEVLQYVREHYMMPLNLHAVAIRYHMSDSAFSRLFQRRVGKKFSVYLRQERMEHAREALLTSERSVTEIAFDCGFASLSAFNKAFRDCYDTTPSELRKTEYSQKENYNFSEEPLRKYVSNQSYTDRKDLHTNKTVFIDMKKSPVSLSGTRTDIINWGMASDLLERTAQEQLSEVALRLGIRYVRLSNVFDPDLGLRNCHDTAPLNFEKLDDIFDFLEQRHLIPVLELPEKLRKVVIDIKDYKAFSMKQHDILVFQTLDEWVDVFESFLDHVIERYTGEKISQWKFEIWFDVEHRTGMGKVPYKEFYSRTYDVLRKRIPRAQILASGQAAELGEKILRGQLRFYQESKKRPDILSLFVYPYVSEKQDGHDRLIAINTDRNFVREEIDRYRRILQEESYPETPIWITEWNTSLAERNAYNDSTAKACHMLTQLIGTFGKVDRMAYWCVSDLHARSFDNRAPFMGATGIVSKNGILKPAGYALEFFRCLGEECLSLGDGYIVTRRKDGNMAIILANPRRFGGIYRQRREGYVAATDLSYIFHDENSKRFNLNFSGLQNGLYQMNTFFIRSDRDNVLTEWKKMGYKSALQKHEILYLKSICVPRMTENEEKVHNGELQLQQTLGANDFLMILLFRKSKEKM